MMAEIHMSFTIAYITSVKKYWYNWGPFSQYYVVFI